MSKAPEKCLYCDHQDPNCGFCEMGKPLDTQEDWDKSWGSLPSRHAVFSECPMCWGAMVPEHAHYRCSQCGFRDSCCD